MTDKLFRILEHSFAQVIRRAKDHRVSHRTAAMAIGVEKRYGSLVAVADLKGWR